jgi:hypothetical protein
MALLQAIQKGVMQATSHTSAIDIFGTDLTIGSQTQGVSTFRIQLVLGTSSILSLIIKRNDANASVIASAQFNAGASLASNVLYNFVHGVNTQFKYNYQVVPTSTITGQVEEIQDGLI